ncbi:MAG: cupin domain-containing protein [Lautropia sp.]
MKSLPLTDEEMQHRTARYAEMKPYQQQHQDARGIPAGALQRLAAHRVYPVMVPVGYKGRGEQAPIKGAAGLIISLTESPPGDGAALHIHEQTIENFFCVSGRFHIQWGDEGEHHIELGPMDFCSVPPGVVRGFKNVSNETGRLLAIIHVQSQEQGDRIAFVPKLQDEIAQQYGQETVDALGRIGVHFDAGVATRS